ncbi:MAG: DNA translocase FtsK, partial [Clostridiales bacterium]|nr:DNA translocase FtsK [Clostridiales bacterium]
ARPARPEKPQARPDRPAAEPAKTPVPAVQQTIGEAAFQPKVKLPAKARDSEPEEEFWAPTPYNYPPITDLAMPKPSNEDTAAEDEMRSRKLEETLASFKVQARVVHVTHGPAISRFEMELASGTKVGNVAKLEKDIAYGMEATSIRIEAPIPGKSLVGVEVPNRKVATVTLREVLQSEKMQSAKSLLTVALGKDLAGAPIVCDLAKMPHMLIAGQTGSGKSVCINAIINSLLYRASPDEVKLILVDPKVVELQCYNGIPHLLIPVVNDPHKAAAALAWAVAEMMERYDKFAERKVRNLDGYNADLGPNEKPMARIVIIIDELADLMMVCKKDVEEYICRLTQLARAAGIHLIVATQRPSVDVITGLIKANIPSRIAFKTASYVDSRTILDRNGSESLLGWGDMLYLPTGSFAPTRVQGCFLSDEEVNRIVKHVRDANPSTYDPDILEKLEEIASGGSADLGGADMIGGAGDMGGGDGNLFEQAVEFAIADGQISTSTLQRRLKIGYARAGRLTDEMEERGIVAAKDGSKPRKCLITREEWEEMKKSTEGMA